MVSIMLTFQQAAELEPAQNTVSTETKLYCPTDQLILLFVSGRSSWRWEPRRAWELHPRSGSLLFWAGGAPDPEVIWVMAVLAIYKVTYTMTVSLWGFGTRSYVPAHCSKPCAWSCAIMCVLTLPVLEYSSSQQPVWAPVRDPLTGFIWNHV